MNSPLVEMTRAVMTECTPFCDDILNLICEYACSIFKPSGELFYYDMNINGAIGRSWKPFIVLQRLGSNNLIIQEINIPNMDRGKVIIRRIYHRNMIEYIRYHSRLISANKKSIYIDGKNIVE
ncbi:MAG: hypothetical protein GTO02_09325 [Candidatus Dadabacteria bacterium]|nr:hypothetical protein [Candidatus Dadabacteria bacterium]